MTRPKLKSRFYTNFALGWHQIIELEYSFHSLKRDVHFQQRNESMFLPQVLTSPLVAMQKTFNHHCLRLGIRFSGEYCAKLNFL